MYIRGRYILYTAVDMVMAMVDVMKNYNIYERN